MTPQTSNIKFTQLQVDKVFDTLTSANAELKNYFDKYLLEEYKDNSSERLDYFDIAEIARFLVDKTKMGGTNFFHQFFNQVELILTNCDGYISNLIVVGLFEGIQNICGTDIDHYSYFDKWLQPLSKQKWDNLIDAWDGKKSRNKKD